MKLTILLYPVIGYIRICKDSKGKLELEDILKDIVIDDYWILKASNNFRVISYEELKELKYSNYVLMKKDLYNIEDINKWITKLREFSKCSIKFLNKPFPPIDILNKIKIIEL